jgi:hypothetical protein
MIAGNGCPRPAFRVAILYSGRVDNGAPQPRKPVPAPRTGAGRLVRPANTDPRNERPGSAGTPGRQRAQPPRRRDVDVDALAAGFDDTSRGMPRPPAEAQPFSFAAPESISLPGTVADAGALLQPIQHTIAAPVSTPPVQEPDTPPPATARTTSMPAPPPRPVTRPATIDPDTDPDIDPLALPDFEESTASDDDLALRAPVVFRRRRRRSRVRRVTRVLRHVDTWSVFKVALVFNLFLYLVCLTAGVLLWQVAYTTGTVSNVERFFEGFGWETFEFKGGEIYHAAWIAGLFVAAGLTGLAVLMATLFNLITDLVGGVRVTVLEEEVLPREVRTPSRVQRAPRAARPPRASRRRARSEALAAVDQVDEPDPGYVDESVDEAYRS